MILELSSFDSALKSLTRALEYAKERFEIAEVSTTEEEMIKAAITQNFEFTYELCWKFMKRWLELNLTPGMLSGASRKELFRYALEQNLITDFSKWAKYHELRNITAHTYNVEVADEIYEMAFEFQKDALNLFKQIEAHND